MNADTERSLQELDYVYTQNLVPPANLRTKSTEIRVADHQWNGRPKIKQSCKELKKIAIVVLSRIQKQQNLQKVFVSRRDEKSWYI